MGKIIGFALVPVGGLIVLYFLPSFSGLLANFLDHSSIGGGTFPRFYLHGVYSILGAVLFGIGVKLLKGENGIVFISLGSVTFMATILSIVFEFFGFSTLATPYSIGEFVANCTLFPFSIVLGYMGITSFNQAKNTTIIDDLD